jgi:hypothetical protein
MKNVPTTTDAEPVAPKRIPTAESEEFRRWLNEPIPEILQTAFAAFGRDLPELLRDHYREWAAYHGNRRIGISPDSATLYALCDAEGIDRADVFITGIYPDDDIEVAF